MIGECVDNQIIFLKKSDVYVLNEGKYLFHHEVFDHLKTMRILRSSNLT